MRSRRIFATPRWRHHVAPVLLVVFIGCLYAAVLLYWAEQQGGIAP